MFHRKVKNKQLRIFAKRVLRRRRYTLQELFKMTYPTKLIRKVLGERNIFERVYLDPQARMWYGGYLEVTNLGDTNENK